MTARWERFKRWLTHGTCERRDCGASIRRMDLRSNQFIAGGLNLCPKCRDLAYVRRHVCCHCGDPGPSHPHHWTHHQSAKSMKPDDYRTVPLCRRCHLDGYHHHGSALPGLDTVGTEALFARVERDLLLAWIESESVLTDEQMVDALVEAMRKMEVT